MKKQQLDLSYAKAATIVLGQYDSLRLVLVGCGGTGSFLAPSIARIARVLKDQGREPDVVFIDPDHVEEVNIPRQNFCEAELGLNKAIALATRYSGAWGLEVRAVAEPYQPQMGRPGRANEVSVILGCVDNAAARKAIAETLRTNNIAEAPRIWWIDSGNMKDSGQVLIGSAPTAKYLNQAFISDKACTNLPCPVMQHPELLKARPEEQANTRMSCAEQAIANQQSLAVNQRVAAEASDYLLRLLSSGLRRFATYFDLESGSSRSRYVTKEELSVYGPIDGYAPKARKANR